MGEQIYYHTSQAWEGLEYWGGHGLEYCGGAKGGGQIHSRHMTS